MRWLLACVLSFGCTATAFGGGCKIGGCALAPPVGVVSAPMIVQTAVVQPVAVMPAQIAVQPVIPVTTLRWGLFHRRLVPRTRYVLGSPIVYQAVQAVQAEPPALNGSEK